MPHLLRARLGRRPAWWNAARVPLPAVLVAAAALALPGPAAAAQPGGVRFTVNGAGGDSVVALTNPQVAARQDVFQQEIAVTGSAPPLYGGTSVTETLGVLGIAAPLVDELWVSTSPFDASGDSATHVVKISQADIAGGFRGDTLPGHKAVIPAAFDANQDSGRLQVRFRRPLRGPGDDNSEDQLDTAAPNPLYVWLKTSGGRLDLTADGPTRIEPGEYAPFTASADSAGGQAPSYRWQFGDGSSSTDQNPQHQYPVAGTYHVSVTATARDRAGVKTLRSIQVGEPAATTPPADSASGDGAGGGTAPTGGSGTGSNSSGPARSAGSGETTTSKTTTTKKPSSTSQPTKKGTAVPRSADQDASTEDQAAATPAAPAPAAAPSATAPAAPAASTPPTSPVATTTPSSTSPAAAEPAPTTPAAASGATSGARVRGILASARLTDTPAIRQALAAADALVQQTPSQQAPTRSAAGPSGTLLGWIGGGVGVLGLLAIGAAREGVRASALLRSS